MTAPSIPAGSRPRGRLRRLLVLTLTLALATSTVAVADEVIADGDGLAPIAANTLQFGTVCANSVTTKPVALAIVKGGGGGGGNRYANGALVDVTVTSVAAPLSAATTVGTITIPSTWSTAADGTVSPSVTSSVTLTVGAPGSVVSSIGYRATPRTSGPTRNTTLDVRATVVQCDTTPPTLHLPGDQTVEATGPAGATVSWVASATDTAPASPAVTCTPASGSTFSIGSRQVSCQATDAAGNTATGSFGVTVRDTTGPVFSGVPTVATVEATSGDGAVVTYTSPTAVDLVDGSRPVTCTPASGSTFALGETTVTCRASDTRGNETTATFVVTVSDTTAPVLVLPGTTVVEATGPSGATATFAASATDAVSGDVTPVCAPPSGSVFALGDTEVSCTATDGAGNATGGSFQVRVVDTTPPTLDLPADRTVEGDTTGGADVSLAAATATDLVDGPVATTCSPGSGFLALGSHTITCEATDAAGNTATGSYDVTVVDTTPPVLTLPADQRVEGDRRGGADVTVTAATATDVVDPSPQVSCDRGSGVYALGTTVVECSATDASGNEATGSFQIEVVDTTGPVITAGDVTAEATGPSGAAVTWSVSAEDVVHGPTPVTCDRASGETYALGATTVSCSSQDPLGNGSSASFVVRVRDTTAPTLHLPGTITTGPTGPTGADVAFTTSATDTVSGSVAVTCNRSSGALFGFGDTTVSCQAADAAGNVATGQFVVRVGGFTRSGFYQPVDMGTATTAVYNTVKGGATVPLKWELFGEGGVEMTSLAAVQGTGPVKVSCASGVAEDAIETVATGGTSLRYDTTGGQYIYNWQTPKQAGSCWRVSVNLVDGSSISALFKLK